jgi:hypothetical protein
MLPIFREVNWLSPKEVKGDRVSKSGERVGLGIDCWFF